MNTRLRHFLIATSVAVLCLVPAVNAADASAPTDIDSVIGARVASIDVSPKLNRTDVQEAVKSSLTARKWIIKDKTDDSFIAHYSHGENEATVTVKYTAQNIDIYCVGKTRNGGLPTRWIEFLKKDIEVQLGRPLASN